MVHERSTKYTRMVQEFLAAKGHATNAEITEHVRISYPDVSATTVHRITTRLVERGEVSLGPTTVQNAVRLDANTIPHDHFQCLECDCVRDVYLEPTVLASLQAQLADCRFSGNLTIQGTCANCLKEKI